MDVEEDIKDLKEEYDKFKEKYGLPDFDKLACDFDIEKIEHESSFVLRDVRLKMTERVAAYLHFFEVLINPASPPIFIFSALKNLNEDDKKNVKEIYKKLSKIQLEGMMRDSIYGEAEEGKFIVSVFNEWQEIKIKVNGILEKLKVGLDLDNNSVKKGYVG